MNRDEATAVAKVVDFLTGREGGDRAQAGVALAVLSRAAARHSGGSVPLSVERAAEVLSVSGSAEYRMVEPLPEATAERLDDEARGTFERAKRIVAERDALRGHDGRDASLQTAITWEQAEDLLNAKTADSLRSGWLSAAQRSAAAARLCARSAREALSEYAAAHQPSRDVAGQSGYVPPAVSSAPSTSAGL